jgi:hypothetical protein
MSIRLCPDAHSIMPDKPVFQPIELDLLKMKRIFAAFAMTAILSACGTDSSSSGKAEEQAAVAKALKDQQVQVAQSMQARWNDRSKSGDPAERGASEGAIRVN